MNAKEAPSHRSFCFVRAISVLSQVSQGNGTGQMRSQNLNFFLNEDVVSHRHMAGLDVINDTRYYRCVPQGTGSLKCIVRCLRPWDPFYRMVHLHPVAPVALCILLAAFARNMRGPRQSHDIAVEKMSEDFDKHKEGVRGCGGPSALRAPLTVYRVLLHDALLCSLTSCSALCPCGHLLPC